MDVPARCKLGLVVPAALHAQMIAAARDPPEAALQDVYAAAFTDLLDALEHGQPIVFAAVRGPKQRVTVRFPGPLCERLRDRLERLNLKITDFACAAIVRSVSRR